MYNGGGGPSQPSQWPVQRPPPMPSQSMGVGGGGGPSTSYPPPPPHSQGPSMVMQQPGNANSPYAYSPSNHDMHMYGRPPPPAPSPTAGAPGFGAPPTQQPVHGALPVSSNGLPAQTTIFVGTISPGVTDEWIKQLLSACGYLHSFKRVNASFGFAEFADPESVLRALAVLAGQELPVMGKEAVAKADGRKKLTVKADEKTQKYLDQYEQGRAKTDVHHDAEKQAAMAVQAIAAQMADAANIVAAESAETSYNTPSHLKDLPPEDVPEEHRGTVLSEIDRFRQASAARDEERKRRERFEEMERARASSGGHSLSSSNTHSRSTATNARFDPSDRQNYLHPVGFVAARQEQEEKSLPADERDAKAEERRAQREMDNRLRAGQEAERRFLEVERNRLGHWKRELEKENTEQRKRHELREAMKKVFASWDQAREEERDMFYFDRSRWRSVRRAVREREERDDEQDRVAQKEEEERARQEAERFLAQQAEDMAAFEREQRAAGVLMPGEKVHAPLKLKRALGASDDVAGVPSHIPSGSVLGSLDDELDDAGQRRKGRLAHIDLTDEETKKERFRATLPTETDALFAMSPAWEKVDARQIEMRYKPLLDKAILESLGESVPDMVEELVEMLAKRGSANDLVQVVEPVLDEEAVLLIQQLWKELLVDTLSAGQ